MYQTVIRFANEVKLLQDQIIWCSFSSSILLLFLNKKQNKKKDKAKQNKTTKPNQTKPNQTPKQKQKTKHHKPKQNNSQKKNLDPKYKFLSLDVSLNYERPALEK